MDKANIYLDYAAATPLDESVKQAMLPFWQDQFFNPSASYSPAIKVRQAINHARQQVAYWLGAKPTEIIFTAGASEANNLAVAGIMSQYPKANIVISSIEHESVLSPASLYDCRLIKVLEDGRLDLNDLRQKIDNQTVLVSVMQANNEIGTIEPLKQVAEIIESIRRQRGSSGLPLYLHSDSTQAANYLDLHVARLGVDLMTLNGGKIYGPKQSGLLYLKSSVKLQPLIMGGGQERNLRSGTENVPAIIGFATALDKAQSLRHEEAKRTLQLRDDFISDLTRAIPGITINGSIKQRLPNNIHVSLPNIDNERLLIQLDAHGILAAAGSACSASSNQPSHVLKAIGKSDLEARSSIRFSLGRKTMSSELKHVTQVMAKLIS
jgi:cysteine desulfurase